ncbi:MAG: hypothetical protein AB8I08_04350 [Sandaracinaceae bacterium]
MTPPRGNEGETWAPIGCVLIPELPIVAHHPSAEVEPDADRTPRAVHAGRGTAARVRWCDRAARTAGVRVGQTLASARARCASLESALLDEARFAESRRAVLSALLECTPRVSPDGPTRMWVEPAPLGDTTAWCDEVQARLAPWGPIQIGIGPWALVAYAAAREGAGVVADPAAFVDALPLDALELPSAARRTLHALGIRRAGALRELPADAIGRLGVEVTEVRRRLRGDDPRGPRTPRVASAPLVRVELEEPIATLGGLTFLLRPAVERLLRDPVARGRGVTEVRLTLTFEGGAFDAPSEETRTARAGTPVCDAATLFELLRAMLEAPDTAPRRSRNSTPRPRDANGPLPHTELDPRGIAAFELRATGTSPRGDRTEPLLGAPARDAATEVAIARLTGRLGEDRVQRAGWKAAASPLARAIWSRDEIAPGGALPWRHQHPPSPIAGGAVWVAGERRRIARRGRIERALGPWWDSGTLVVDRLAWLEVEGPLLVLARERRDTRPPRWEAVAWLD